MAIGGSGFAPQVLTNNALVLTVQPGTIYSGGSSNYVITPTTSITCGASTTTYVYFNPQTGTVTSNTTGMPPQCYAIAVVTTGASAITGIADVRSDFQQVETGAMFFTTAPSVLQTCNTTVQNVITYTLPAGLLNTPGKTIRFKAAGNILNTTTAGGLQVGLQLGGVNCVLVNSANITQTASPFWQTELVLQTANTGVNGNIEGHGLLGVQLTASGAAINMAVTPDQVSAVSANINLQNAQTLGFIALTNGAISNFQARYATLEILN